MIFITFQLYLQFKENVIGKGCWIQIGIVSWGWGCGSTYTENGIKHQFPGYYTSVAALMPWITEIQQQTKSGSVPISRKFGNLPNKNKRLQKLP